MVTGALQLIRLVTIHPALVHFTLGVLPVLMIGYTLAVWRRSERWSFVADAALVIGAVITLVTFSFGLVSNAMVAWSGGIVTWRWLHLAFGSLTTLLFVVLALVRLGMRRRDRLAGLGTFLAASALTVAAAVTGWIGGEILVFRSGVAVTAAAEGGLAPPVGAERGLPHDLVDCMGRIRGHWASALVRSAGMIVQQPSDREFASIAEDARRIQQLARWAQTDGGRTLRAVGGRQQVRGEEHPHDHGEASAEAREQLASMAQLLERRAGEIEAGANHKDLAQVTAALARTSAVCGGCHEQLRWLP